MGHGLSNRDNGFAVVQFQGGARGEAKRTRSSNSRRDGVAAALRGRERLMISSLPVAEFEKVGKNYRQAVLGRRVLPAFRNVSFRIEPGEVFGLLGPNRAGKTTLVKILLSLCRPARAGQPLRPAGADRSTLAQGRLRARNQAFPRY